MAPRERIYTESLLIRYSKADQATLDAARGSRSKAEFVRRLIRAAAPATPDPVQEPVAVAETPVEHHTHRFHRDKDSAHSYRGVIHYTTRCECGETREVT